MNGRKKIEAAFSVQGSKEFPVVICYEYIFIRDHWDQLTDEPWWYLHSPEIKHQLEWRREVINKIGEDWYSYPEEVFYNYNNHLSVRLIDNKVYIYNSETKEKKELLKPPVGGYLIKPIDSENKIETIDGFNRWYNSNIIQEFNNIDSSITKESDSIHFNNTKDLNKNLYSIIHIGAPLWRCFELWGFEKTMMFLIDKPELVNHACKSFRDNNINHIKFASKLGISGVWIEDCMSDLISLEHYRYYNLKHLKDITDVIRENKMNSIYYFCGNPYKKLDSLIDTGADGLSLEEGKKGFNINIEDIVDFIKGRMVVFGNLDSVNVLERGSAEDLKEEILRQISAGRKNNNRFIVNLGSPVTPATKVDRVRLYCDIAHSIVESKK